MKNSSAYKVNTKDTMKFSVTSSNISTNEDLKIMEISPTTQVKMVAVKKAIIRGVGFFIIVQICIQLLLRWLRNFRLTFRVIF